MQLTILMLLILGLIYIPVETIVVIVGITLIGSIRHVVKMKETADYRASIKGSSERLANPNYVKPRWFTTPLAAYTAIAGFIALLVYFY